MILTDLLIHVVSFQVAELEQTSSGANQRLWHTTQTEVPCRIQPVPTALKEEFQQRDLPAEYQVYFHHTVMLTPVQRVLWDNRPYEVVQIENSVESSRPTVARIRALNLEF